MRLSMELSADSINKAIRQLNDYEKRLTAKCELFCQRLGDVGVSAALAVVRRDTTALASSIRFERINGTDYAVIAEGEYIAFVEFGTGVVGQGTYPKDMSIEWSYDQRNTPAAHDKLDPSKWYYRDKEGRIRGTRGQTANAFMANASEGMRQAVFKIAKEVFAR